MVIVFNGMAIFFTQEKAQENEINKFFGMMHYAVTKHEEEGRPLSGEYS